MDSSRLDELRRFGSSKMSEKWLPQCILFMKDNNPKHDVFISSKKMGPVKWSKDLKRTGRCRDMRLLLFTCLLVLGFSKMIFDESRFLAGHPERLYGQTCSNWLSQEDEAGNSGHPQVPGKSCHSEFDVFLPCFQI